MKAAISTSQIWDYKIKFKLGKQPIFRFVYAVSKKKLEML